MEINQKRAGIVLSYLGQVVKILVNLIYTPIMLRILGQSEYGLYQLVFSVVSYLSLLSLGFSSSYMRFYSQYKANNDYDGISRLNGMFLVVFNILSIICIVCGIIMIKNIHLIFGDGLTASEYNRASILMGLLVFNMALTFPNSVYNCSITAHERFLFQKLLILLQNLVSPFITLPLLILGYGSIGMVSVTTILTFLILVSNIVFCRRKLNIHFIFKGFQWSLIKEIWGFTFFIFLNQIIDQINWSLDKFLLGRFAGTSAVAIYGVGSQINSMYLEFSGSISNVFVPKVNYIVAESDDNMKLTQLFTKVGRIQFVILGLILSGFIFFGKVFIQFWAGDGYNESYVVTMLLIVPVTVPLIQNLGIEIQRAKNMHRARAVVYLVVALLNIIISIPLTKQFGAIGAAIGTAISLIVGNIFFMNWYYHKRIKIDMMYFWKKIFSFVPALIIPLIFGVFIVKFINITRITQFVFLILIYTVLYSLSMYFLGMNIQEKQLVIEPIKKIINVKR